MQVEQRRPTFRNIGASKRFRPRFRRYSRRTVASVWESTDGDPALYYWKGWFPSCREGDITFLREALAFGIDVDQLDDEAEPGRGKGRTALQEASVRGNVKVVNLLLEHNPSIDHQDYWDGRTALMEAARCGHAEVVVSLIRAGASLDVQDFEGMTAYDWAERFNRNVDDKRRVTMNRAFD
mmetsp:Transcript_32243/g.63003  ORF Transcript_32243/g.63003 Transcript_32243/m.63003 type:complete len:181 (+) Transcript_32243:133-675(+)|eukprot:CAMPEP_0167778320 /NCGR_PEP_ID=MMETSP0111_2-20121227/4188_1 /TAXON_ID=91324 /ORGANISM="Lotharella globosa, Strain CCCM811" /LENGTH=180 /DNA_ID=CAMNT_0007668611 /DNA_START=130 /DNA_END=672 /DNA_ORIENTATION=-